MAHQTPHCLWESRGSVGLVSMSVREETTWFEVVLAVSLSSWVSHPVIDVLLEDGALSVDSAYQGLSGNSNDGVGGSKPALKMLTTC